MKRSILRTKHPSAGVCHDIQTFCILLIDISRLRCIAIPTPRVAVFEAVVPEQLCAKRCPAT